MKLKANPYHVFEAQDDPISLHVRRKFLNENGQTQKIIEQSILRITGQLSNDGSWDHSVRRTIENLFALWLLVEEAFGPIQTAMDWLLELKNPPPLGPGDKFSDIFGKISENDRADTRHMRNVPFTPGCFVYVKTGAALFLAMGFDRQNDSVVSKAYEYVNQVAIDSNGRQCSGPCGHNLRLAMAVHPTLRNGEGMQRILDYLASNQEKTGSWSARIPFYPTLYMLSFLDLPQANILFENALSRVLRSQISDGELGKKSEKTGHLPCAGFAGAQRC